MSTIDYHARCTCNEENRGSYTEHEPCQNCQELQEFYGYWGEHQNAMTRIREIAERMGEDIDIELDEMFGIWQDIEQKLREEY